MPGIEKMKRKDGRSEGKKKRLWDGRKKEVIGLGKGRNVSKI